MSCEPRAPIRVMLSEGEATQPALSDEEQRTGLRAAGFTLAACYAWREGEGRGWETHEEVWLRDDTLAWIDARGVLHLRTRTVSGSAIETSGPDFTGPWNAHRQRVAAADSPPAPVGSWREAPGAEQLVYLAWHRLTARHNDQHLNDLSRRSSLRLTLLAAAALTAVISGPLSWQPGWFARAGVAASVLIGAWIAAPRVFRGPFPPVPGEAELEALFPDLAPPPATAPGPSLPRLLWLHPEGDPRIAELSRARPEDRAMLTSLGFRRVGALRKRVDLGLHGHPLFHDIGALALEGRLLSERWVSAEGDVTAEIDQSPEAELALRTVLEDGSLVTSTWVGPRTMADVGDGIWLDADEGAWTFIAAGEPSPELLAVHRGRVEEARQATGAAIVPLRTLEDVLFAERLSARISTMAGAARAAGMLSQGPNSVQVVLFVLVLWFDVRRDGAPGWASAVFFLLLLLPLARETRRLTRATAPPRLPVAKLRELPCRAGPSGALGDWIG